MRQQEHTPLQSHEAFGQHILPRQTPGCKVILDDVRLIVVVAELAVQTPVTQVEFTEGGQADEAAGPGAAPVPVAERLQANDILLGGDVGSCSHSSLQWGTCLKLQMHVAWLLCRAHPRSLTVMMLADPDGVSPEACGALFLLSGPEQETACLWYSGTVCT